MVILFILLYLFILLLLLFYYFIKETSQNLVLGLIKGVGKQYLIQQKFFCFFRHLSELNAKRTCLNYCMSKKYIHDSIQNTYIYIYI